jgi:hypothetical protein
LWQAAKKVPDTSIIDGEKVMANSYHALLHQNVLTWLSATYADGSLVLQQHGLPVQYLLPFPFRVSGGQHDFTLVKYSLPAVFAGHESFGL